MDSVRYAANPRLGKDEFTPVGAAAAREALAFWRGAPFYSPSPLVRLAGAERSLGLGEVWLKDEGRRFGPGSFKLLGAGYAMARALVPEGPLSWERAAASPRRLRFFTATDGNHGRAVAWLARRLGQRARVLMPAGSSRERFEAIAAEGTEVSVEDANYDECVRRARRMADEGGGVLLQDTTLPGYEALPLEIMRGYGALCAEAREQLSEAPTHVILQAGVGSFAGAAAGALAELCAPAEMTFMVAECAAAPCLMLSAAAGERRVVGGELKTIMAGLACGEPCDIGLRSLMYRAGYFAALPDAWAAEAMRSLAREGVTAGESGAAGCGLLLALMRAPELRELREAAGLNEHSRVLLFNTETATDRENYRAIVGNFAGHPASNAV